ncbi:MAG TPA: SDR family oxidoreductase [Blastocatellia bacterium]|nr:SDR family oxidoreductase [Blastocatellia bacterium]
MKKLDGKIALITGASGGIGRAMAEAFAAEGASLILTARNADKLRQIAAALEAGGTDALVAPADVTSEEDVNRLFEQALARFNRLDILVNNAGVFDGGPLDQLTVEAWDKVIAVNLRGPFLCTRQAMRVMKEQRGGRIINIGSIAAQRVRPFSAPYATSKHGLWGLTQVTALEGRDYGITCGCLHPGNTEVESLVDERKRLREPVMKAEDLAQAALAMAALPPNINMLDAIVLPIDQLYIGRG